VHPFELGLYVAPQFVGTDNKNAISVSTVVHFTFLNSFGFGAGCRFWENGYGGGFKNPSNNRLFMTLGYSFANQND
jgi:hypothetical protein